MTTILLGSFLFLLFVLQRTSIDALSDEGLILLKFKMNLLNSDDVLHSWNASSDNPCRWSGVRCDLTNMRVNYLNLPYRHLSGTISAELGKLNQLRRLGLHENAFIGSIPAELQNLTALKALYLRGNTLTGEIPPALGDLFSLEILDVSRNALTGAIPDSLGNLSRLHFLNVSANFLGGAIPATGSLPNFTSSSFQGNLNLCGPQINVLCSGTAPPPAAAHTTPPCTTVPTGLEVCREPSTAKYLNGILVTITAVAVLLGVFTFSCSFLYCRKHSPGKVFASGSYQVKSPSAMARLVMFHGDLPYATKDVLRKIELLDDTDVIGSGGFGTVYRLVMEDESWFAVKKIGKSGLGSERLFERELEILGSVKHKNLVNLRGYCNSPSSKLLIYDYLPFGSLDEFLHGNVIDARALNQKLNSSSYLHEDMTCIYVRIWQWIERIFVKLTLIHIPTSVEREPHEIPLNWAARLKIAIGTARALAYLHHDCCPRIIHRDIKSSNILLDDKLEPHVSDFGLAKLLDDEESHATTIVAGTFGYLAPEYMNNGRATDKGDVYSYGVVLLELLSGKRPTDACFVEKGLNVVGWVAACVREAHHEEIFDSKCPGQQMESMEKVLQLAVMCIAADPDNRPSMEQVVQLLEIDTFTPWPSDLEYESDLDKECEEKATKKIIDRQTSSATAGRGCVERVQ